jgi:hypothetical protein
MAGIKVTDLPVLGAAAPDDVMYIVDTSTNSSKQIAVSDFGVSGTFTPVASDLTGSVTITGGCYSKSGQVVTMSFQFEGEAEAGTTGIVFDFTLPVAATFTNGRQLFGSNSSNPDLALMIFQSASNKGRIIIETQDVDQTVQNITVVIQYIIP